MNRRSLITGLASIIAAPTIGVVASQADKSALKGIFTVSEKWTRRSGSQHIAVLWPPADMPNAKPVLIFEEGQVVVEWTDGIRRFVQHVDQRS